MSRHVEAALFRVGIPARWQWRLYHGWHAAVHVGLRRYRYLCHYCALRDASRQGGGKDTP